MNKEEKIKLIGRNIAKFRKEKHLSQNKLAELANVSREHIAKAETGKRCISISLLFEISCILDIEEKYFFEFNKEN